VVVDNRSVFQNPENLADKLFDDDSFSISKKYFWAINFLHEFIRLIDDNIEQWERYRKTRLGSAVQLRHLTTEHHMKISDEALRLYESQAVQACLELQSLRQAFYQKLEQVKVMRDGVSSLQVDSTQ
jgi:uncharacterized protein YfaA (DUF2138 family)